MATFNTGDLLKNSAGLMYLIDNNQKLLIPDLGTLDALTLGLGEKLITQADDKALNGIPNGTSFASLTAFIAANRLVPPFIKNIAKGLGDYTKLPGRMAAVIEAVAAMYTDAIANPEKWGNRIQSIRTSGGSASPATQALIKLLTQAASNAINDILKKFNIDPATSQPAIDDAVDKTGDAVADGNSDDNAKNDADAKDKEGDKEDDKDDTDVKNDADAKDEKDQSKEGQKDDKEEDKDSKDDKDEKDAEKDKDDKDNKDAKDDPENQKNEKDHKDEPDQKNDKDSKDGKDDKDDQDNQKNEKDEKDDKDEEDSDPGDDIEKLTKSEHKDKKITGKESNDLTKSWNSLNA